MSTEISLDPVNTTIRRVPYPALKEGRAFDGQMTLALRERVDALMATLIPPENTESYSHGEGFVFQRVDSTLGSGDFQLKTVMEEMKTESIVSNDLQVFLSFMESLAQGFVRQMTQLLLQRAGEAAESVGNVVALQEGQSAADAYIELMSKVEFSIDRHGNLSFPKPGGSPAALQRFQAMLQEQGPEYHQRLAVIAREKAAEAIRREQERLAKYKTPDEAA